MAGQAHEKPEFAPIGGKEAVRAATAPEKKRSRGKAKVVLVGLIVALLITGATIFFVTRGQESTDDAQIEGHITTISSRVLGQIQKLLVKDNEVVEVGQPLVELDNTELEARLVAAQADVSAARAGLQSSEADVDAAQSRFRLAELDLMRAKKLRAGSVISRAEFDAKQAQYDQAKAALDQATARLGVAPGPSPGAEDQAGKGVNKQRVAPSNAKAAVGVGLARVQQAEAALKLAEVNRSYATIKAPTRGVVSRRMAEVGQFVAPGTPLLALVDLDDVWIVANFKEDQIADMRSAQKAKVTIDTFGHHEFAAHVDSIAGASGSKFALLPPDNASGNFVKVVQRVPVLIRIDRNSNDSDKFTLRPGMSAAVTVYTTDKTLSGRSGR